MFFGTRKKDAVPLAVYMLTVVTAASDQSFNAGDGVENWWPAVTLVPIVARYNQSTVPY